MVPVVLTQGLVLVRVLVPVLTVVVMMAVIVAGMLLAFYLPMFQAISAVQATR